MPSTNVTHFLFVALVLAVAFIALMMLMDASKNAALKNPPRNTSTLDTTRGIPRFAIRPRITSDPASVPGKSKPLTITEVTPAVAPWTQSKAMAVDLSSAFNRNFLAELKRVSRGAEGIPDDGRVPVPGSVPRSFFQLAAATTDNAVLLVEKITVTLSEKQRGKYEKIAFLHGAPESGGPVHVALHYSTGEDQLLQLQTVNWNTKKRREKLEAKEYAAVQTLGTDGRINAELFSETFTIDAERMLESITFEPDSNAAIFGVTAIPPDDPAGK
jgi:hypothetical protein